MAPAVVSPLYRYYRIYSIQNSRKSDTKTPDLQNVNKKYTFQQNNKSFCRWTLAFGANQNYLKHELRDYSVKRTSLEVKWFAWLADSLKCSWMSWLRFCWINCEQRIRSQYTGIREDQQFITICTLYLFTSAQSAEVFSSFGSSFTEKSNRYATGWYSCDLHIEVYCVGDLRAKEKMP